MRMFVIAVGLAIAVTCAGFSQVGAGAPDRDRIELTRQAILAKRQEIVTNAIDLTPEEKGSFWPLYRDWRAKVAGLGDRTVKLIEQVMDNYDDLSDQQASRMLDDWLRLERDRVKLKTQYVKRFRRIMPDRKVARLFQLDNKLDAIVNYDLVDRVPLVE